MDPVHRSITPGPKGVDYAIVYDPTRFVLSEVYYTEDDPAKHKETSHYQAWKAAVEPMMAEPRASVKMDSVFPYDDGWKAQ